MKVVKLACFVVAVGFILQSNLYNTHANPLIPIAKFIGEYLLGKGLDYIWDKRTGKPDVTELQRRIKDLEDVVIQTDPKLADPFKKLFIRINPDTSKEDFQRMAQEVHKDFMRRVADLEGRVDKMERSTEKTDKKIASLSEGLAKLSERLAKLESYPKGDPPTRVPFSAPAAPQPISPIPSLTWERTFGSLQGDTAQAVAVTRDGGYIVAGTTQSKGAGKSDAWLLKLDALGQLEWERTFGGPQDDKVSNNAQAVAVTRDGGYILIGSTESKGARRGEAWLLKLDAQGQLKWERTFGGPQAGYGPITEAVAETRGGGYIVVGSNLPKDAGRTDAWVLKLDVLGQLEWERMFGGEESDQAKAVAVMADGGYIVAGTTESKGAGKSDAWLLKLDALGRLEWEHTFGGPQADTAQAVAMTHDGGYIVAGTTWSKGDGRAAAWVLKLDALEH